jgi:hypothetical protein
LSELIAKRYAIACISKLVATNPFDRLPDIVTHVREQVESTSHELERLGHPPSDDGIGEVNTLVDQLVSDIKEGIERVSREEGNLLYRIEDEARRFKSDLRATCPEFRAWSESTKEPESFTPLPDLLLEEGEKPTPGEKPIPARTYKIVFLDEVLNKKTR